MSGAQRYHGSLKKVEAQVVINNLLTRMQENLDYIKSKLQSHGDVAVSRWSKKSIDKRRKLLSASAEFCFVAHGHQDRPLIAYPRRASVIGTLKKAKK